MSACLKIWLHVMPSNYVIIKHGGTQLCFGSIEHIELSFKHLAKIKSQMHFAKEFFHLFLNPQTFQKKFNLYDSKFIRDFAKNYNMFKKLHHLMRFICPFIFPHFLTNVTFVKQTPI